MTGRKMTDEDEVILHKLLGQKVPPSRPIGFPPAVENLLDDVEYLLELPEDEFLSRDENTTSSPFKLAFLY
jgi:hypothetical protein